MDYVKSPLNYVGGKFKLLPQILPLFPDKIETFVDLFGGGANISVNVKADKIVYNDINIRVVQILETFKKESVQSLLCYIDSIIEKYKLSKTNAEGFIELRKAYNSQKYKDPIILYTLICYAFNYQIRFNSKGEYNMPFGKNRSSFNNTLRKKFINFVERLHDINIIFTNSNFEEYYDVNIEKNDFVYCDPPYLDSTAVYNENGGWTQDNENALYNYLNYLTNKDIKWALSNDLAVNRMVYIFAKEMKYNIHYLEANYGNCNYHKKNRNKGQEVLITNY
jgi:DNA adenine methylase Dam